MIEVRRIGSAAGAAGAQLLSAVHAACFEEPWGEVAIARLLDGPGLCGLAAADTECSADLVPLGMALCRVAGGEAEILTLGVIPERRRQGVGGQLVGECYAIAKAGGAAAMFLEVAADNGAALALYSEAGFRQVGRRENYYQAQNKRETTRDALILRVALP